MRQMPRAASSSDDLYQPRRGMKSPSGWIRLLWVALRALRGVSGLKSAEGETLRDGGRVNYPQLTGLLLKINGSGRMYRLPCGSSTVLSA